MFQRRREFKAPATTPMHEPRAIRAARSVFKMCIVLAMKYPGQLSDRRPGAITGSSLRFWLGTTYTQVHSQPPDRHLLALLLLVAEDP